MPETLELLTAALNAALKDGPPLKEPDATIASLKTLEKPIKKAIAARWNPTQLAGHLRKAGVKVSQERLRRTIQEIAGIPPRIYRGSDQQKEP